MQKQEFGVWPKAHDLLKTNKKKKKLKWAVYQLSPTVDLFLFCTNLFTYYSFSFVQLYNIFSGLFEKLSGVWQFECVAGVS